MKRKLGFLGKKGYDIFGRNKLFAPRIRWDTLKSIAQNVKNTAKEYESAFNGIKSSVENKASFQQVSYAFLTLYLKVFTADFTIWADIKHATSTFCLINNC